MRDERIKTKVKNHHMARRLASKSVTLDKLDQLELSGERLSDL